MIEHAPCKPYPARLRRYSHLPDKDLLWRARRPISGDPSDHLSVALGQHACVREMRALQQIAIGGIDVERRAVRDQRGDLWSVRRYWRTQVNSACSSYTLPLLDGARVRRPPGGLDRFDNADCFLSRSFIFMHRFGCRSSAQACNILNQLKYLNLQPRRRDLSRPEIGGTLGKNRALSFGNRSKIAVGPSLWRSQDKFL